MPSRSWERKKVINDEGWGCTRAIGCNADRFKVVETMASHEWESDSTGQSVVDLRSGLNDGFEVLTHDGRFSAFGLSNR